VLNSKSKPVSTDDFLTLQKNCLAPTLMKLSFHKLKYICYNGKRKCAIAAGVMYVVVSMVMDVFFQVF